MSNLEQHRAILAAADGALLEAPAAEHVVQFYETDQFLAEAVSRFLAQGVVAGEAVVIVATPEHAASILAGLTRKGFDVERARADGQLTVLDARETLGRLMIGDTPDWDLFLETVGGAMTRAIGVSTASRARAYGEMVDLLWRSGRQKQAIALEDLWERLRTRYPFSLLCAYVMGNFYKESHSGDFRHVCDVHDQVRPSEAYLGTGDDNARLRQISVLQQRALALETELLHRKELEEALRCSREQAEAASRAKDEFLAMLGHELRNPLSPILTALELMKLRGDGQVTREQEVIERQTKHLTRLVDDLLDVSRVTRGVLELRRQRIDLRDVLAKAAEIASPMLEIRRHHFEVHAPARGVLLLDADEARLSQVIANLLTNAAKYTPPEGNVSLHARNELGEVVIEVRDDGNGIDSDLLPRVFDLFVQGRQPVDRGDGGLGIGLALVRSLVQLHGGSVSAQSSGSGKGSVFTVRLPAPERVEPAASAGHRRSSVRRTSRGRRILLVDDNEDALEMLAELLRAAGHNVLTAGDGPAALAAAPRFRPDIAVLDIGLPAMDGYELASRLRAQAGGEAPILVALSGYGQDGDRTRSDAAGFALHLVKPIDAEQLLGALEERF
ncbi:MAG: response regulator [Deltaproteobacteria bacterium]|nr:MAG: response regulator [Deltaproteobacteria bacterium]TMB40120.1 MAG: response regulator [Deltaproteobacteria bacterium]